MTTPLERSRGNIKIHVVRDGHTSRAVTQFQSGASKIRFPRAPHGQHALEAVIVNTAGGITGGDVYENDISLQHDSKLMLCGQACEKIYKSSGGHAIQQTRAMIQEGASLEWLPQPAILFNGGRLKRTIAIDMAATASLLAVEATILGRSAMQETVTVGMLDDRWEIRIEGKLILYDRMQLEDNFAQMANSPSCLDGKRAFATIVMIGGDLEEKQAALRESNPNGHVGASIRDNMLLVRFLCPDGQCLIADLITVLSLLRGQPMPRFWNM